MLNFGLFVKIALISKFLIRKFSFANITSNSNFSTKIISGQSYSETTFDLRTLYLEKCPQISIFDPKILVLEKVSRIPIVHKKFFGKNSVNSKFLAKNADLPNYFEFQIFYSKTLFLSKLRRIPIYPKVLLLEKLPRFSIFLQFQFLTQQLFIFQNYFEFQFFDPTSDTFISFLRWSTIFIII